MADSKALKESMASQLVQWHSNHGKKKSEAENTGNLIKVGAKRFLFAQRYRIGSHKLVFGYHLSSNDTLSARYWYWSNSESCWRAGIGFRKDGSYHKGAEDHTAPRNSTNPLDYHQPHGYVMEGLVVPQLDAHLDEYFEKLFGTVVRAEEWLIKFDTHRASMPLGMDPIEGFPALIQFIQSGVELNGDAVTSSRNVAGIEEEYHVERKYINVLQGKVSDRHYGNTALQEGYQSNRPDPRSKEKRDGKSHVYKEQTDIWSTWILNSLGRRIAQNAFRLYPDEAECRSEIFQLPCDDHEIYIEISYSEDPVVHNYNNPSGKITLNTPYCWVRNIYINNSEWTTFGAFKNCPINLAFLVQKPFDYARQTSQYYLRQLNIGFTQAQGQKLEIDRGPLVSPINRVDPRRDQYVVLSLFNEATSPLIKQFKKLKGFPLFRFKYRTLDRKMLDDPETFPIQKKLIMQGVEEYELLHDQEKGDRSKGLFGVGGSIFRGVRHGEDGKRRAELLKIKLGTCTDHSSILDVLNQCFASRPSGDFAAISGNIGTNPKSLFTCICRSLLPLYLIEASKYEMNAGERIQATPTTLAAGNDGLLRMAHWAISHRGQTGDDSVDVYLTKKSDDILKEFRRGLPGK